MTRYYMDCRDLRSENNCDVRMSGSEDHLVEAAAVHAITAHGHADTPQLREDLRKMMKEDVETSTAEVASCEM